MSHFHEIIIESINMNPIDVEPIPHIKTIDNDGNNVIIIGDLSSNIGTTEDVWLTSSTHGINDFLPGLIGRYGVLASGLNNLINKGGNFSLQLMVHGNHGCSVGPSVFSYKSGRTPTCQFNVLYQTGGYHYALAQCIADDDMYIVDSNNPSQRLFNVTKGSTYPALLRLNNNQKNYFELAASAYHNAGGSLSDIEIAIDDHFHYFNTQYPCHEKVKMTTN